MEKNKKKAWFITEIAELKSKLEAAEMRTKDVGLDHNSYADGYFDCLTKYQLLSKTQRRIIRDKMKQQGPTFNRNFKWSSRRFASAVNK